MLLRHLVLAGSGLGALVVAAAAHAQAPATVSPAATQAGERTADATDDLNQIVVTARRFEERLQDVPIAVTAFGAEDLARRRLDNFSDIARQTPGLSFEAITPVVVQPAIRGQTNLRTTSPVQNVAFYVDGLYLQRGYLVDQTLLDLERIEIIKGPQSALYGRNAFAGAINIVTRSPSLDDLGLRASATYGNYDRFDVRGSVTIPVVPGKLAVLLSAAHSEYDGSWRNNHPLANAEGAATRGNLGGWKKDTYQARVIFQPSDDLRLDALYIRTDRSIDAQPSYTIGTANLVSPFNTLNASPRPNPTPPFAVQNRLFVGELPATPIVSPLDTTRPPGLVVDPRAFGLRGPTDLFTGKVEFTPNGGPITAAYQFGLAKARIIARGSPSPNPLTPVIVPSFVPGLPPTNFGTIFDSSGTDSAFRGYSHEARFSYSSEQWRGLLGFLYSRTRDIDSNATEFAPVNSLTPPNPALRFPIGPGLPFPNSLFQRTTYLERTEDVFSVYGLIERKSDVIDLSLEGRWTLEDQKATDFLTRENPIPGTPGNAIQALNPPTLARTFKYFTPRGTITFKLSPDSNIYASVARGVKSGGFNGVVPFVPQRSYLPEKNWTYEIGTKNNLFGGTLQLNAAAYHTDWTDLQTTAVRLQANGTLPNLFAIVPSVTGNVGGVSVWGAEIEGLLRLTPELRLNFGASYNRSKYKEGSFSQRFGATGNCDGVVCAAVAVPGQLTPVVPLAGKQLERVPRFNAVAGLNYDAEISPTARLFARADVTYQTKAYVDEVNLAFVPDRTLANGSIGVGFGAFTIEAWIKNAFDRKYVTGALFLIGTNGLLSSSYVPTLGERRTFGVTGSISF